VRGMFERPVALQFYLLVTTGRCTFVARSTVVRRNVKMKLAVAFVVLLFATLAHADSTENFTITGGATASGTLTLGPLLGDNGGQEIIGITGTIDGQTISGLVGEGWWLPDQSIIDLAPYMEFTTNPIVGPDTGTLWVLQHSPWPGCSVSSGFTVCGLTGWDYLLFPIGANSPYVNPIEVTFTDIPSVPEPSSLLLSGIGFTVLLCLFAKLKTNAANN
jgi:PEP-CTERM motif